MATINGIGTTRYDWRGRSDGTAEATVWFVVFFFPIIPLRREHLRVIDSGIKRSGVLATLGALVGAGVGYQTSIQFLGTMPLWPIPVLRTYFMGFVVAPLLTVGLPVTLMIGTVMALERFGMEPNADKMAPIVGIGGLLWVGCVVARILDRSAGRCHVTPISHVAEPSGEPVPAGRIHNSAAVAKSGTREWDEAIWAAGAAGDRPEWADVMWYGVDAHGRVGMFTSGGPGPIPRAVFRDLDAYNALDEYLRGLPGVGKPELLIRYPRTTDWQRAAERGLFAFNYESESGRPDGYRLVARPTAPLSMCELPEWVQAELSEACLRGESFAEGTERVADLSGVRCGLVS